HPPGRADGPSSKPAAVDDGLPEDDPAERAAAVHYSFLPEEVHLKAGGDRETTVHLRCVGDVPPGGMTGRLQFVPPQGVTVDPPAADVAGMAEGDEKDVTVRLKAAGDVPTGLFAVSRNPAGGDQAIRRDDAHGAWAFHYRLPCRFVFDGRNDGLPALTLVSGGQDSQVRMRYTFYEDRIVAALVQPTDPRDE